jgi:hypothetical protein
MHAPLKHPPSSTSLPSRVRCWTHRIRNGLMTAMRWLPVPELLLALGLLLIWGAIR